MVYWEFFKRRCPRNIAGATAVDTAGAVSAFEAADAALISPRVKKEDARTSVMLTKITKQTTMAHPRGKHNRHPLRVIVKELVEE